jgi:hypothetical protein
MTPAQAIGMLDRQLAQHGSTLNLFRGDAAAVPVRGFPRGYDPDEIGSGISQGDTQVVISPTHLSGTVFETALPRKLDQIEFGGRRRNIENAEPVLLDDVVVRINLQVRG